VGFLAKIALRTVRLFLQPRLPVRHDCQRDARRALFHRDLDQEAAVFADVELPLGRDLEQRLGNARVEARAVPLYLDGH